MKKLRHLWAVGDLVYHHLPRQPLPCFPTYLWLLPVDQLPRHINIQTSMSEKHLLNSTMNLQLFEYTCCIDKQPPQDATSIGCAHLRRGEL